MSYGHIIYSAADSVFTPYRLSHLELKRQVSFRGVRRFIYSIVKHDMECYKSCLFFFSNRSTKQHGINMT